MSSTTGSDGADPSSSDFAGESRSRGADSLLLESLIHVLVEKGVLTKNDALSVVQTAAEVTRGAVNESAGQQIAADLKLLHSLYTSFELLDDAPRSVNFDGENVRRLRPPLHGDRPQFPHND